MNNKVIMHKLTLKDKAVSFVECDETLGTKYSIKDFLGMCINYTLNNYDGFGEFIFNIKGKNYTAIDEFAFNIDEDIVYYEREELCSILIFCRNFGIKEVMWYNK